MIKLSVFNRAWVDEPLKDLTCLGRCNNCGYEAIECRCNRGPVSTRSGRYVEHSPNLRHAVKLAIAASDIHNAHIYQNGVWQVTYHKAKTADIRERIEAR